MAIAGGKNMVRGAYITFPVSPRCSGPWETRTFGARTPPALRARIVYRHWGGADGECDGRNARSSTTVGWEGGTRPPPLSLSHMVSPGITHHFGISVTPTPPGLRPPPPPPRGRGSHGDTRWAAVHGSSPGTPRTLGCEGIAIGRGADGECDVPERDCQDGRSIPPVSIA